MALCKRRTATLASENIGLVVAAGESRIDLAIQFLLDEPAAAGSRLEFSCQAQVLSTPHTEPSNAFDVDAGGAADALGIDKTFQSLK